MLRLLQWLIRQEWLLRALRPVIGLFNPFLPEHRREPQTTWRAMRAASPIYKSRVFATHLCTGYDDVMHVLRSPCFSTDRSAVPAMRWITRMARGEPDFQGMLARNLLMMDGADHRHVRGLVAKAFTPRRVEALRPRLEATVDALLDRVSENGEMEVVRDLAHAFPVIAIIELLGVPEEDRDRFSAWSARLVQLLDPFQGRGGAPPLIQATNEIFAYFRPLLAERRLEPRDDLLSAMLEAEQGGERLAEVDLLALSSLLLVAGHETTSNLIGNSVLLMLRFPDERKRLLDDLSLLPSAVDECLRYESPVCGEARWWRRCWRRRTATRSAFRTRSASTSAARTISISRSAWATTSVWAHSSPSSRASSRSAHCCGAFRTSAAIPNRRPGAAR
jgi:cytochrome P450